MTAVHRPVPVRPPKGTTALQLDPLAAISARGFLVVVALVSVATAGALTIATASQVSSWPLAIAALVALLLGYGWFIRSAFRFDLGVTSDRFAMSFALIAISAVLNSLSCLGTNIVIRDDWGLLIVGLALMAAAPFRTYSELGVYTVVAGAIAVALSVFHDLASFGDAIPLPVIVLVALAPPLAFGLGSVAYARTLLTGIYLERLMQAEQREAQYEELRRTFVDDDVIGQMGALREEIVPFLARVRQSGTLTVEDRVRAGVLATDLQLAIAQSRQADSLEAHVDVLVDEAGLSAQLHEDDRATLRALLSALRASGSTLPGSIRLELMEGEADRFGILRCASDDVRSLRTELLPFIRMTRLMFRSASEQVVGRELLIQFDIDRLA
ncbi:hypothetical protein N1031_17065 [Herbiconiux moechotypicola]|uniref:Uncharacterized protein n=1 Tax=Herbiconiux moechotypicola TaxID=637393 RepID=A0ABN3DRQ2_9MICO|nr:hypothetical protein [Herbiconiux moechotypicola]MCS5731474.1 hypothetical protein [Herbiconiux moechotypicola]